MADGLTRKERIARRQSTVHHQFEADIEHQQDLLSQINTLTQQRAEEHAQEAEAHKKETAALKHRALWRQSTVHHQFEADKEHQRVLQQQIEARPHDRMEERDNEQAEHKRQVAAQRHRALRRQSTVHHAKEADLAHAKFLQEQIDARTHERAEEHAQEAEAHKKDVQGLNYRMARRQSAVHHAKEADVEHARQLQERIEARTNERAAQHAAEAERIKEQNAQMKYRMARRKSLAHHQAEERNAAAAVLLSEIGVEAGPQPVVRTSRKKEPPREPTPPPQPPKQRTPRGRKAREGTQVPEPPAGEPPPEKTPRGRRAAKAKAKPPEAQPQEAAQPGWPAHQQWSDPYGQPYANAVAKIQGGFDPGYNPWIPVAPPPSHWPVMSFEQFCAYMQQQQAQASPR